MEELKSSSYAVSEQLWGAGSLVFLVINARVRYQYDSARVQNIPAYTIRCSEQERHFCKLASFLGTEILHHRNIQFPAHKKG